MKNLSNSFPGKSMEELRVIERQFYKNLADTSVETFKLLSISEKNLLKRVRIDNSLTLSHKEKGWSTFIMTSHFCNWEWLLVACSNKLGMQIHAAYQRLRNRFFNNLMIRIRSRFGAVMHEKEELIRDLIRLKGELFIMAMVADQRPFSGENKYWSKFLNQDSAMYSGTEVLAKRMNIKVIYASMTRVKRGYYNVCFKEISNDPPSSRPNEIIEKFIRFTEEDVSNDPASYLWSHDRWKHAKPTE